MKTVENFSVNIEKLFDQFKIQIFNINDFELSYPLRTYSKALLYFIKISSFKNFTRILFAFFCCLCSLYALVIGTMGSL